MNMTGNYKDRTITSDDCNLFFTSDTHFGSERALELSRRPFKSVEEMDETMLKNINDMCKVTEQAYLVHLGDFGNHEFVRRINVPVILILGNYEMKEIEDGFNGDYKSYRRCLMDRFGYADIAIHAEIESHGNRDLWLAHDPIDCINDRDNSRRFVNQKSPNGVFYLFGHIHGRQKVKPFGIDVGVDGNHFRPMPLKDVWFYENAIRNHYDKSVWCQ